MAALPLQSVRLNRGVKRDPALPVLKRVQPGHVHPLRAHCFASTSASFTAEQRIGVQNLPDTANTYVYEMEENVKDTIKRHRASREIKLERPFAAGLIQKGLIRLKPGDAVFARPFGGKEDGTEDVLQVLVLSNGHIHTAQVEALHLARDKILGPVDERGPTVPVGGVGGTAFERSGYADPVEDGARAYSILTSEQKVRGRTVGPGVACKVRPQDRNAAGPAIRQETLRAAVNAGVAAAKYLPVAYQDALKTQADLVNAPRFGSDDNYLYSSVQVNIARPVPFATAGQRLEDLGSFGEPHIDRGDLPEGFTSIQVCSHLPQDIDPGQFIVIELGVFVDLEGTLFVLFRGVQYHTGCAPRPKRSDVVIPDWAYRVLLVAYPKAAVFLALGQYILGSMRTVRDAKLPNKRAKAKAKAKKAKAKAKAKAKEVEGYDGDNESASYTTDSEVDEDDRDVSRRYLAIGPDILNNPESKSQKTWITHPNFARDAHALMSAESLMKFFAQSLYSLNVYAVRQIPESYGVQIDADQFLSAFSFLDETGERKSLKSWQYAPRVNDPDGNAARRAAASSWKEFSAQVTKVIPFSIVRERKRAADVRKGKPVPRQFDVHGVDHESGTDGAERPTDKFFKPVRTFKRKATVQKDKDPLSGPAASAGRRKRAKAGQDTARSLSARSEDDSSSNSTHNSDENTTCAPRRSQRQLAKRPMQQSDSSSAAEEEDAPPRKKLRSSQDQSRKSAGPSSVDALLPSRSESEPAAYLSWLQKLLAGFPERARPRTTLRDAFLARHIPYVSALGFQVQQGSVIHPWTNPLNGPLGSWDTGASPCLHIENVPVLGQNMFTFDALDHDFFAAFQQTRTALSSYMSSLDQLPDVLGRAVTSSSSDSVQSSMEAVAQAWTGLQRLRARLTSNSLFLRAEAVTLMAHEFILCTCLETLATHNLSHRTETRDNHLSALTSALWPLIDARSDTREVTFEHNAASYTVELSASPRSLKSDFDKQRMVYIACLDRLCDHMGVDDARLFRLRAWLVGCVVETLGFDALFHTEVWLGWQFPATRCSSMRLRKEPSLDLLLPLLGHLGECFGVADRPPSALASLALAISSPEERERCIVAARWIASSLSPVACTALEEVPAQSQAPRIYRSLAVLALLIDIPYDPQSRTGAIDVSGLAFFALHGVQTALTTADRALLAKAARNPDMYLPYRVHSPSAQRLRGLFGTQYPEVLLTDLGFRNLVATRYMSYNTPFLLSGEQQFATRLEDLMDSINQEPRRPTEHFLNHKIYGQNRSRFLDRLPDVWNSTTWPSELGRNFLAVWKALYFGVGKSDKKYKIRNAGQLLALQICGDYFVAGLLDPPTISEMGEIIHKVDAGGVKGLVFMGFLEGSEDDRYELGVVQAAFTRYYECVTSMTTNDERIRWSWNVVTAENHLCKHSRLHDLIDEIEP